MSVSRRNFVVMAGAAVAAINTGALNQAWAEGSDVARDQSQEATEDVSAGAALAAEAEMSSKPAVCDGCSTSCTFKAQVQGEVLVALQGDAENPYTKGKLCPRGYALAALGREDVTAASSISSAATQRLESPRVRRPGSTSWESISWGSALEEIAEKVKATRDATFVEKVNDIPVMRTEAIASFGGGRLTLEEQFMLAKLLRSWGVVHIDNEAVFGRRVFSEATKATLGLAEPDGSFADLRNAQLIVVLGADVAESHPVAFQHILDAQDEGVQLLVVDPVHSRTAEAADIKVALRPGTDIAFLGGLIKYLIDQSRWQPEYVLNYTNASYLVKKAYDFNTETGLFSGWNEEEASYDTDSWNYQTDSKEAWNKYYNGDYSWVWSSGTPSFTTPQLMKPKRDVTLQGPKTVWAQLQHQYERYDLDRVSAVCGVSKEALEAAYAAIASTRETEASAAFVVGAGLVQHATGPQAVRACAMAQLLLGNLGMPGGGLTYVGGVAHEMTADLVGLQPYEFAGGLPCPTEETPSLSEWLTTYTEAAGTHALRAHAMVSACKEWWEEEYDQYDDYGFDYLPKAPDEAGFMVALQEQRAEGCFLWGTDPLARFVGALDTQTLSKLDWLVVAESTRNATAEFWEEAADPSAVNTTVYQLPTTQGIEKEGVRAADGRVLTYGEALLPAYGNCRSEAALIADLHERVYRLYEGSGGTAEEPVLKTAWSFGGKEGPQLAQVMRSISGFARSKSSSSYYYSENTDWDTYVVESANDLVSTGHTACAVAPLAGCWVAGVDASWEEQPIGRRDATDESGLHLYSKWGYSWPRNVRVRANRASANLSGVPWNEAKTLVSWDGKKWVEVDVADFPTVRGVKPLEPDNAAFPSLWEGAGLLFSNRLADGPLPEHYEPLESAVANALSSCQSNPLFVERASFLKRLGWGGAEVVDAALVEALASDASNVEVDAEKYPVVVVLNSLRQERISERDTSAALSLTEPTCYVEISEPLAKARNIATGDVVRVYNDRGSVALPALVTARVAPFVCGDTTVEVAYVNGLRYDAHAVTGPEEKGTNAACASTLLMPAAVHTVGGASETKGFLGQIEKA